MSDRPHQPTEGWLERINDELAQQGMTARQRPWEALKRWSLETGRSIALNAPEASTIFEWFKANSKPGTHQIGPLYEGLYFFDGTIWPVYIPVFYGTVTLDLEKALEAMPTGVLERLKRSRKHVVEASSVWLDCLDFSLGMDDLGKTKKLAPFAEELLLSGDRDLRSTVELLGNVRPSQKGIETARMATELFMKSYLAQLAGLTDDGARKISHNLEEALAQCLTVNANFELASASEHLGHFPPVGDRYKPGSRSEGELWQAYSIAQFVGTTVVRELSGRDSRPSEGTP